MSDTESRTFSSKCFDTPDLSIAAALTGKQHQFQFEGWNVRIRLPLTSEAGEGEHDRLLRTSFRDADQSPVSYYVRDVDLEIDQPESANIQAALNAEKPPAGAGFVDAMGPVSAAAFSHWIRVVRWKLKNWRIGRLRRVQAPISGIRLIQRSTGRTVASGAIHLTANILPDVTVEDWNRIQESLALQASPPLYYDIFFDGQEHLDEGDFRRAVVDFANACEVLLKTLLDRKTQMGLFEAARSYVLRAPARTLLKQFAPELLGRPGTDALKPQRRSLERLFDARNEVLHSHQPALLTRESCSDFRRATSELLKIGEAALDKTP